MSQAAVPSGLASSQVLGGLPKTLRDDLAGALNEVLRNYRERRWEPSELNGGKLAEVAYSILRGHVDGKFPAKSSKPKNMVDACKSLEQADPNKFSRSVRIQIPRMLVALYEIRNNRGVGHIGGDVDPNLMDATAVLAMSKWVVAELVRIFHAVTTSEAEEAVEALVERSVPVVWNVGDAFRILNPAMSAKDKALLLLYQSRGWVDEDDLRSWVEYQNASMFRAILIKCHRQKLLEYDAPQRRLAISPAGTDYVETKVKLHR